MTKPSEHFDYSEFSCKCCGSIGDKQMINTLSIMLEELRITWGKPIKIVSGYRCEAYNKKVKGAKSSQHLLSRAADIVIKGVPPKEIASCAKRIGFKGIGIYDSFIHLDIRLGRCATWRG